MRTTNYQFYAVKESKIDEGGRLQIQLDGHLEESTTVEKLGKPNGKAIMVIGYFEELKSWVFDFEGILYEHCRVTPFGYSFLPLDKEFDVSKPSNTTTQWIL